MLAMMGRLRRAWSRLFLDERPSLMLGLFRLAVAGTVGLHMIPHFFHLSDTFLATGFKELNPSFFPIWALRLVAHSPDWLVYAMVGVFLVSWFGFLIGLATQASCLVMTLACYYFYALNALHIGTLSFDILLVTLSLVWVTPYPGDFFSVDSILRGDERAYQRPRPFFIQRLLQWQIWWTFWYTALSKMTAGGNWLTDRPFYYLVHYPPEGVVKNFPFRDWFAHQPALCYWLGIILIVCELTLPVLLLCRRTRLFGLLLGLAFHIKLVVTLHVPTIFFFLFPPQMALFVEPEVVVSWIERRRVMWANRPKPLLLWDGKCGFCRASIKRLHALDLFNRIRTEDFRPAPDVATFHPQLTVDRLERRMQLVDRRFDLLRRHGWALGGCPIRVFHDSWREILRCHGVFSATHRGSSNYRERH